MILLSIDCGVRGCGVAEFRGASLVRATYVKNPVRHGQGGESALSMAREVKAFFGRAGKDYRFAPDQLAIETMRWYDSGSQKGDQNDLGGVQLVAGALIGIMGCDVRSYTPSEWKGTIDADVCTNRILERLSVMEKSAVVRVGELDHNTYDAIGIGLKYLGRFEPRRVYARE